MFNSISNLLAKKDLKSESDGQNILMIGLSNAGKTAILYRLVLNEFVTTIYTFRFNTETFHLPPIAPVSSSSQALKKYTIQDFSGSFYNIRLWPNLIKNGNPVIFVVDSAEPDWFPEAREALWRTLSQCDDSAAFEILLVLCNKQDHPDAASVREIKEKLGLDDLLRRQLREKRWHIRGVSAKTGEGLWAAFEWLETQLAGPRRNRE